MSAKLVVRSLVLGLVLFVSEASAQASAPTNGPMNGRAIRQEGKLERLLEGRTPEERARLVERLEKLRKLAPEERRALLERARALHEMEKRVHAGAPDELRRRLREDPKQAKRVWRGHFETELRSHGRRNAERLPPEVRRRLRNAPPEERERILRRAQSKKLDLRRLARILKLRPEELRRIESLEPAERSAAYLGLRRRLIEFVAKRDGPPRGFSDKEWKRLRSATDLGFFRELRARGFNARSFDR